MTDLEKTEERFNISKEAFNALQQVASKHRKLSHDKHCNGHFTKALDELNKVVMAESALLVRMRTVGR